MKFFALIGSALLLAGCQHAIITEHFSSPLNPVPVHAVKISRDAPTNAVLIARIFCNDEDLKQNVKTLKKSAATLGANLLMVSGGEKSSIQMRQQILCWAIPSTWGAKTNWKYQTYEFAGDAFFVP